MPRSIYFLLVLLVLLSTSAFAKDSTFEKQDYARMLATYNDCVASPHNTKYKCDCAAVKFMDSVSTERRNMRRQGLDEKEIGNRLYAKLDAIKSKSYRECVNRDGVALNSYGQCLEWALKSRDDYREFCGCYALRYADTFDQEGLNYYADPASVMARAMITCNRQLDNNR